MADIGIIGGGIIGLTCGVVLADAGHQVTIYSRTPFEASTSWAAGAVCYPFGVEETQRSIDWFLYTYNKVGEMLRDHVPGICDAPWQKFCLEHEPEIPFWFEHLEGTRLLDAGECPAPYKSGIFAPLYMMGVDGYAPYMQARFTDAGGQSVISDVKDFAEVKGDILLNCAGVRAQSLTGDDGVFPARGQVVVVKNPGIPRYTAVFEKKFYIYPRGEQVLLGGSYDEHEWDRTPDDELTRDILEWAGAMEPQLKDSEVIDVRVGLRPMRSTVRLEKESLEDGRSLIHNYGHGGAGYTLSWGCAQEVLKLVETL